LAPRFFLVLDEQSVTSRFKLPSRLFYIVNIKLKPCLWGGNAVRPSIFAETRLRRLRKRPQGKSLCALKRFGMKIAIAFFFERNTKRSSVQLATLTRVANDWTKPCDEQNFDATCTCEMGFSSTAIPAFAHSDNWTSHDLATIIQRKTRRLGVHCREAGPEIKIPARLPNREPC
jgi:hypothetical protein